MSQLLATSITTIQIIHRYFEPIKTFSTRIFFDEASRGAAARSVTVETTGSVFDPHLRKYLLKFIFPLLRSGVEAKSGVECCHSTRNASRIRQKVRTGVS